MSVTDATQFYINGAFTASQGGTDMPIHNPSEDEVCGTVTLGSQADGEVAIAAVKSAFASWSTSTKAMRVELVEAILARYEAHADDLAHAISTEMGAPIDYARLLMPAGSWHIENFLMAMKDFELVQPLGDHCPR